MTPSPDLRADLSGRFDRLAQGLTDAVVTLRRKAPRGPVAALDRVLARATEAANALTAASTAVAGVPIDPTPEEAQAWAQWLHDLLTPVNAVSGWLTLLAHTTDAGQWARGAESIDRNAEKLGRLLKQPPG
jgi:hypothetical protein